MTALANQPVHVVATLPAGLPSDVTVGPNATVVEFVPHGPVLDRAVCAVTHGGMGATQKALARGVPVCGATWARPIRGRTAGRGSPLRHPAAGQEADRGPAVGQSTSGNEHDRRCTACRGRLRSDRRRRPWRRPHRETRAQPQVVSQRKRVTQVNTVDNVIRQPGSAAQQSSETVCSTEASDNPSQLMLDQIP